jgi:hypothetical protein
MKIIALLICAAILATCQNTHRQHRHTQHTTPVENTTVISSDKTSTLVPKGWVDRYHRMEKSDGTVPEDAQIYAEGDAFRIPPAVVAHFEEMVRSQ